MQDRVRIDRWLWAARFFKTRSLASEAVAGGRVHVNGTRAKPSKAVVVGDHLEITVGQTVFEVEVRGLSDRRGPATEAQALYDESDASRERRAREAEERRMTRVPGVDMGTRPTKRDRRRLDDLRGGR
ncbi:MAG: RNA-binding S4 domain-containing protein [Actinomycetota bacterium]